MAFHHHWHNAQLSCIVCCPVCFCPLCLSAPPVDWQNQKIIHTAVCCGTPHMIKAFFREQILSCNWSHMQEEDGSHTVSNRILTLQSLHMCRPLCNEFWCLDLCAINESIMHLLSLHPLMQSALNHSFNQSTFQAFSKWENNLSLDCSLFSSSTSTRACCLCASPHFSHSWIQSLLLSRQSWSSSALWPGASNWFGQQSLLAGWSLCAKVVVCTNMPCEVFIFLFSRHPVQRELGPSLDGNSNACLMGYEYVFHPS